MVQHGLSPMSVRTWSAIRNTDPYRQRQYPLLHCGNKTHRQPHCRHYHWSYSSTQRTPTGRNPASDSFSLTSTHSSNSFSAFSHSNRDKCFASLSTENSYYTCDSISAIDFTNLICCQLFGISCIFGDHVSYTTSLAGYGTEDRSCSFLGTHNENSRSSLSLHYILSITSQISHPSLRQKCAW